MQFNIDNWYQCFNFAKGGSDYIYLRRNNLYPAREAIGIWEMKANRNHKGRLSPMMKNIA